MHYPPEIQVMMKAARKAGRKLIRDFHDVEQLQVSKKGTRDFVTKSDLMSEKIIMEELKQARPSYAFLTEESGESGRSDAVHRWVVDPLDGTVNFMHGVPLFCIAIALEKANDKHREIEAAIVYAPALQETFWAMKGKGAWLEKEGGRTQRLRVSAHDKMTDALFVCGSVRSSSEKALQIRDLLIQQAAATRCYGSTALSLAYVASGNIDVFYHAGTKPWDVASGRLLVQEAGGFFTDNCMNSKVDHYSRNIMSGNAEMFDVVGKLLRKNLS